MSSETRTEAYVTDVHQNCAFAADANGQEFVVVFNRFVNADSLRIGDAIHGIQVHRTRHRGKLALIDVHRHFQVPDLATGCLESVEAHVGITYETYGFARDEAGYDFIVLRPGLVPGQLVQGRPESRGGAGSCRPCSGPVMHPRIKVLTGLVVGRLRVVAFSHVNRKRQRYGGFVVIVVW